MQKHVSLFVFTLTLPNFMSTIADRVNSLLDSCVYLLKITKEQFDDKLGEYVKPISYFKN